MRAGLRAGAKPSRMVSSGSTASSSQIVTARFLVRPSVGANVIVRSAMAKSAPATSQVLRTVAVLSDSTATLKVMSVLPPPLMVTGTSTVPAETFSATVTRCAPAGVALAPNATVASPPSSSSKLKDTSPAAAVLAFQPEAAVVTVTLRTRSVTCAVVSSVMPASKLTRRSPSATVTVVGVVPCAANWVTVNSNPPVGARSPRVISNSMGVPSVPMPLRAPVSLTASENVWAGSRTFTATSSTVVSPL